MVDPTALVTEAAKKLGEAVAHVGKNYLVALVAEAFTPALEDGINGCLDEAKEALGKKEETTEEGLIWDKEEKQPDTFWVTVTKTTICEPKFGSKFPYYDTFVVRIGHVDGKDGKDFYVNAQYFPCRYNQIQKVPDYVKKDHKDAKVPDFPDSYQMGGTCCFCITKTPGDITEHTQLMFNYFDSLFKTVPTSKRVADHFRVGDEWEIQQTAKTIFFSAIAQTASDLGAEWSPDIDPFDEVEAVTELLKSYVVGTVLQTVLDPIEKSEMPAIAKNAALGVARGGVSTAIETAAKGWEPLQVAAAKAGEIATKKMQENAEKVVDMFKPLIEKAVALIKTKMEAKAAEKGDEKKEVEEDKGDKTSIGDIVSKWQFQKTAIGKALYENLEKQTAVEAVKTSSTEITSKLREAVKKPLDAIVETLCGTVFVHDYWTQWQIWWMARKITNFICEITTLEGFLDASHKLATAVDKHVEEEGKSCTGKKEDVEKFIEGASAALWKSLADEAVGLWSKIYSLTASIESVFASQPEEVTAPLVELLSGIFEVQVRGFNSIRVSYTRKLKDLLADAKDHDGVKAASRTALRDAIFENVNILAKEHWTRTHEALTEAAKAYVTDRYINEVWPSIKSGLDDLLSLLPEEVASIGVDIAGIVLKISIIMINKGVVWAMNKIGLRLEKAIFEQEGGYEERD
jgi:hypothetical protein